MSTMALACGATLRSTLNPNAPLFIPAAFQRVEDFSPEWWELVKTTAWFREHWVRQHQVQETFDGYDEEDVVNLLPDSFDLGIGEELLGIELEFDGTAHHQIAEKSKPGIDAEAIIRSLNVKSPKNGFKALSEPGKHREKPMQYVSPKNSLRRTIHQPR